MEDIQRICSKIYPFLLDDTDIRQALLVADGRALVMQIDLPTSRVIEQCVGDESLNDEEVQICNTLIFFIDNLIEKMQWKVEACYLTHLEEIQGCKLYYGEIEFETQNGKIRIATNAVDLIVCMFYYSVKLFIAELLLQDSGIEFPTHIDDDQEEFTLNLEFPEKEGQDGVVRASQSNSKYDTTVQNIAKREYHANGR